MDILKEILWNQPYPCFRLIRVPAGLQHKLKKGMLCLYNIDQRLFSFPIAGDLQPEDLDGAVEFIGYYAVEDFRDLVFSGRLPVTCPSCKGPVQEAGMISFEVEEGGEVEVDFISGDAELYLCDFCARPFAVMPIE